MDRPLTEGLRAVKLPVTDLARSLAWYQLVFGVVPELEFPDEGGVVRGVACSVPGVAATEIALREDPDAARRYAGFDPVAWHVPDLPALERWSAFLDGVGHHLYTRATHGIDSAGRPGTGRRVVA